MCNPQVDPRYICGRTEEVQLTIPPDPPLLFVLWDDENDQIERVGEPRKHASPV